MSEKVYEIITQKVMEHLRNGVAPWRKPWNAATQWPRNIAGRRYHGLNVFLLIMQGYASPYWLTFRQIGEHGAEILDSERKRYTIVTYWNRLKVKNPTPDDPNGVKVIPFLKYFRVWNIGQTTLTPIGQAESGEPLVSVPAEQIVSGYVGTPAGPTMGENGVKAYYQNGPDHIMVPPRKAFDSLDEFYSTVYHEMGHSTGHVTRLDRWSGKSDRWRFGSHEYGRDELVAEMTAAFLCAEAGIMSTVEHSASYLDSWIRTISEDTRAVVVAAGAAQKSANLILGRPAYAGEDQEAKALSSV